MIAPPAAACSGSTDLPSFVREVSVHFKACTALRYRRHVITVITALWHTPSDSSLALWRCPPHCLMINLMASIDLTQKQIKRRFSFSEFRPPPPHLPVPPTPVHTSARLLGKRKSERRSSEVLRGDPEIQRCAPPSTTQRRVTCSSTPYSRYTLVFASLLQASPPQMSENPIIAILF